MIRTDTDTGEREYVYTDTERFRGIQRSWKRNLTCTDYDLVWTDWKRKESLAYLEYKWYDAPPVDSDNVQLTVMATDAQRLGKPAFFVRWADNKDGADIPTLFLAYPLNSKALSWIQFEGEIYTERSFVELQCEVRGRGRPSLEGLSDAYSDLNWPEDDPPLIE